MNSTAQRLLPLMFALLPVAVAGESAPWGDARILSKPGEPLRIHVTTQLSNPADWDSACVLMKEPEAPASAESAYLRPQNTELTLIETRAGRFVQLRAKEIIGTPRVSFTLYNRCEADGMSVRTYEVSPPQEANSPATTTQPNTLAPTDVSDWFVFKGDTLALIAKGIFPGKPEYQKQFIETTRVLNANLSKQEDEEQLPVGTKIKLPELKSFSQRMAGHSSSPAADKTSQNILRAQPPQIAVPAKDLPQPKGISQPKGIPPPPASLPEKKPQSPAISPPAKEKSAVSEKPAVAHKPELALKLRLSAPDLDLSRSRNISEAARDQLRARRLILDLDDQVAALLALKHQLASAQGKPNEQRGTDVKPVLPSPIPAEGNKAAHSPLQGHSANDATQSKRNQKNDDAFSLDDIDPFVALSVGLFVLVVIMLALRRQLKPFASTKIKRAQNDKKTGVTKDNEDDLDADTTLPPLPAPAIDPLRSTEQPVLMPVSPRPTAITPSLQIPAPDAKTLAKLKKAIENHPQEIKHWLALFEYLHSQREIITFMEFAEKFSLVFGNSPEWKDVQASGRSLDPQNPLYQ